MESKNSLPDVLWNNIKPGSSTDFDKFFRTDERSLNENTNDSFFHRFLYSSLDETRLFYGNLCSEAVLEFLDTKSLMFFRKALLRRELSAEIDYQKQRDHSAHTVHNFLLGWYIFSNSSDFKKYFYESIKVRNFPKINAPVSYWFGNLWTYVSLMHDIGYLFEGSLLPLSTEHQSIRVNNGAAILQEYYTQRIWREYGMSSAHDKQLILSLANVSLPDVPTGTLASIANGLRVVGSLESLREKVLQETAENQHPCEEIIKMQYGLPKDAFDLWRVYHEYHGLTGMVDRINNMEDAFEALIWEGMPGNGIRLVDHGVAGGLLLLQVLTFIYQLYHGMPDSVPSNSDEYKAWIRYQKSKETNGIAFPAHFWWKSHVWATCATALHSVLQIKKQQPQQTIFESSPLGVEEDPLAYLGILVDILEEWDRYTVTRNSVIVGGIPLQGTDVRLFIDKGRINIQYDDEERSDSIKISLNHSLNDWDQFVRVF